MSGNSRAKISVLLEQMEEMWSHLETLFAIVDANDGWAQKHGADWTFADLPYHLAYCNRDMVGRGLELGSDLPEAEQDFIGSMAELGAWNARKFAERPPGQTVKQELVEWRASCDRLRQLMVELNDDDLERPLWFPLFVGWTEVSVGLRFVCAHDWSEFIQLRVHMGRADPVPGPAITHAFLGFVLPFMPMMANQEAAANRTFSVVMAFTDPGVGPWTIRVADGDITLSEGAAANADLTITQSAETFEKSRQGMHDPTEAIQSGEIRVSDFEQLAIFGQIFPS